MRVYRCISAREVTNIYKGESQRIPLYKGVNTHNYKKGEDYIHFFRYSQSAEMYKQSAEFGSTNPLDRFVLIMTANIPNDVLNKYMGYGMYSTNFVGSDYCMAKRVDVENSGIIPLPEYAIPMSEFKKDYIVMLDDYVNYDLKSDDIEYKKYLTLLDVLYKKFGSYEKATEFLRENNLQKLLKVKDDNRTEKQIEEEKRKVFSRIFSGERFLKI